MQQIFPPKKGGQGVVSLQDNPLQALRARRRACSPPFGKGDLTSTARNESKRPPLDKGGLQGGFERSLCSRLRAPGSPTQQPASASLRNASLIARRRQLEILQSARAGVKGHPQAECSAITRKFHSAFLAAITRHGLAHLARSP